MVGSLLTFCTLMSLLETREIVAQVENSLVSAPASSAEVIQLVAAETIPANETTDPVLQLLDRAIETTGKRTLTANSHSPWQIFHSILAMRENTEVRLGNQKVNAIQWLSTAEPQFDNQPWLLLTLPASADPRSCHRGVTRLHNGVTAIKISFNSDSKPS
jgi:hypothetical protein